MVETRKSVFGTSVIVSENERVLVIEDGRFLDILKAGKHKLGSKAELQINSYRLSIPEFTSPYIEPLFQERPDLAEAHLQEFRTGAFEVAVVSQDGRLYGVLPPDGRTVFWRDAGPWEVEYIDVSGDLQLGHDMALRQARLGSTDKVKQFAVAPYQKGLLYVDNVFVRILEPGNYGFWSVGRSVLVRTIDMRVHAAEVNAQEMLTKDRVTIRVNLFADYQVTDPAKAIASVADFEQAIYRALQFAYRKALATRTLDEILAGKAEVDTEVAGTIREAMAEIGIKVGDVVLKDVILPGEMREILTQLVAAEKEAQANVIRRREETAATRSLLNTAKVMQENPIMLRLKELEALEAISGRVGSLTVHNGTEGLLQDLVRIAEPEKSGA